MPQGENETTRPPGDGAAGDEHAQSAVSTIAPVMDGAEMLLRFTEFLERPCATLDIRLARWKGEAWEVSPKSETAIWPAAPFDFPDRQEI